MRCRLRTGFLKAGLWDCVLFEKLQGGASGGEGVEAVNGVLGKFILNICMEKLISCKR